MFSVAALTASGPAEMVSPESSAKMERALRRVFSADSIISLTTLIWFWSEVILCWFES